MTTSTQPELYYQIHFRRGNRKPEFKLFKHKGNLPSAIQTGRDFCAKMDYKFCGVFDAEIDMTLDLEAIKKMRQEENTLSGMPA